jgi:hypothetical protein
MASMKRIGSLQKLFAALVELTTALLIDARAQGFSVFYKGHVLFLLDATKSHLVYGCRAFIITRPFFFVPFFEPFSFLANFRI